MTSGVDLFLCAMSCRTDTVRRSTVRTSLRDSLSSLSTSPASASSGARVPTPQPNFSTNSRWALSLPSLSQITAADYVCSITLPLYIPLKTTPLLMSANDIAHEEFGRFCFCNINLGDFSHTLLAMFGTWMVIIYGFPPVVYPSLNRGRYLLCSHGWCMGTGEGSKLFN